MNRNNLLDGKYKFSDIVDIPQLTKIFTKFSKATGFTIGLVDNNSLEILVKTGWHDICVNFHRADEKACEVCKKSNKILFTDLEKEKSVKIVECEHGLYDSATPIIIEGKHIANLATGQLLMQKPDILQFKQQAKDFNFDEQSYLKALQEVPIINRQKVTEIMDYLAEFSIYIAEKGLNKLRTNKLNKKLKKQNKELRKAKQQAEESQTRLSILINTIPDLIWLKDIEGIYLECNQRFENFFGVKKNLIIGKTDYDFVDKKSADFSRSHDKAAMTADIPTINEEYITFANDGHKEFLETIKAPIYNNEKKTVGVLGIGRDISERKKTEKELKISKEEAEKNNQLKTEFLNNMSHEIRTPMNGILGFSKFLENTDLTDAKRKHYINIIQNSGNQLMRIIDDILEISKLGTKQVKVTEKEICLNDLLLEHFSFFSIKAKENKIPLYFKKGLSDEESIILTDETKLNKILSNLLENALKYTNEGFVEFGYQLKNTELVIYVKDTGIGIKPENQKTIFDRFSQEEKELSKNIGGLGLGLSIAKENTELLDGKITVQSEKEKGSTFFVTIPYKPINSNAENKNVK